MEKLVVWNEIPMHIHSLNKIAFPFHLATVVLLSMMPIYPARNSSAYGSLESPPSHRQEIRVYTLLFAAQKWLRLWCLGRLTLWSRAATQSLIRGCHTVRRCTNCLIISSHHAYPSKHAREWEQTRKQHGSSRAKYDDDRRKTVFITHPEINELV